MRIDNHVHIGFDPLFYLQGWSPYCADIPRLLNESAGSGIDNYVVFPFIAYMDLDMEKLRQNQIELSGAEGAVPYKFENWRLCTDIMRCPDDLRRRFWPFLIADPSRKPIEQIQEWKKLPPDYHVYGIKFQTHTIKSPILSLLEEGSCMLDYAEENNLSLLIHTSTHPDDKWSQCSDILRIVESRPAIRFVLAHACCFHHGFLNRAAELPNAWFDSAAHVIRCECAVRNMLSVAVAEERFPSDYTNPERVLEDLATAYPGKLIWGSDSPYYSIEYSRVNIRGSYQRDVACLNALSEDVRDRIARRNTLAWLGQDEEPGRIL